MTADMLPATKLCKTCGRELPLESFYRDPHGRDGRKSMCIPCRKYRRRTVWAAEPGPVFRVHNGVRFPVWDLLHLMGYRKGQQGWASLAAPRLGLEPGGLAATASDPGSWPWPQADLYAVRAGYHPGIVWPGLWWE